MQAINPKISWRNNCNIIFNDYIVNKNSQLKLFFKIECIKENIKTFAQDLTDNFHKITENV